MFKSETPAHKSNRSLSRDVARSATLSFAANAAGTVGFLSGLVFFGKLLERKNKTENKTDPVTDPKVD